MTPLAVLTEELRTLVEEGEAVHWTLQELPVDELFRAFRIEFDRKNDKKLGYLIKRLEDGNEFPPVMVLKKPKGFQILDGHHRIAAYHETGRDKIAALVGAVEGRR